MKKISVCLIGCFIMVLLFSMFPSSVLAAGYRTYDGSIDTYQNFRDGTNNTVGYDADGYYDRQCWDGVQVFYKRLGMSLSTGNIYNSNGEREGYAKHCWDDANARAVNTGDQFTQITRIEDVKRGDIVVFNGPFYTGHIAFADEDNNPNKSTIVVWGQNQVGDGSGYPFTAKEWNKNYFLGAFRYKGWNVEVRGTPMSVGYDRVLPDGNYLIATSGTSDSDKSSFFYLDIEGTAVPATNSTNVSLCGPLSIDPPAYEIWTLTYNESDKFYTISQMGTGMCLDVYGADTLQGQNVQVYNSNGGPAQKWAISRNGGSGFRLQAKCSGMSLDVSGGAVNTSGTNVQQWSDNDTAAQSWLFIPYQPSQPIEEGRYILLYTVDPAYEADVSGDSGDIPSNTPVQIWNDQALSQYNSFDFIKLSNGYYKVRHAASGMCLDVTNGSSAYKAKITVHGDNGSPAQQWAIVPNGTGYSLIARCNGYAFDLPNGTTANGTQIEVYPPLVNDHQRWSFVQAERKIRYYAADADNEVPETQIKYYKTPLVLSEQIPTREGYTFQYWEDLTAMDENMEAQRYYPGDTYTEDFPMALYAVWQSNEYTITYNANGGAGAPEAVTVSGGATTLSAAEPSRAHHRFLGWATSADAEQAQYQPGGSYGGGTATLYAVWQRVFDNLFILPRTLTVIEEEAFLDSAADAVFIPATVTETGANAFGDVAVYAYAGSYAETWAKTNGKVFIPITDGWVLADQMPQSAQITEEKWTYQKADTETTTSTETAMEGWTQGSYIWQETGSGTYEYVIFPSGFDTGHALYNSYGKAPLTMAEIGTTKREGSVPVHKSYIYWHWTFTDYVDDSNRNVSIEDAQKYGVQTGTVYRDYTYFDAFETTLSLSTEGMTTSGLRSYDGLWSTYHHPEYNLPEYASWWWYRAEVMQQDYTEYQKLFTYTRTVTTDETSSVPVTEGEGISNVLHWVKYEM